MIDNSADKENALRIGESFRIAREKHNITLIQAAEKLKIRSFLLNDMEKGRFGHLRTRDCLVYAKFLGLKISQDDIENLRKSQGGEAQDNTESNKKVVAIGAAAVVGAFLVIAVIISSLSGRNREQNDSGMLQLPQNETGETSTLALPQQSAGSDSTSVTLPLNSAEVHTVQQPVTVNEPETTADKQSSVAVEQPAVRENKTESGVVIGGDSSEPTFRSLPDVDPEDVKPAAPVKRDTGRNTVMEERSVQTNSTSIRVINENNQVNTQQTTVQRTGSKKTPAVQQAKKTEAPVSAKKNQDNSAGTAVSRNTAVASKSTGLKAGQVVSLADEMGVKKTPAVKQAPVAKQSASAVKRSFPSSSAASPPCICVGRTKETIPPKKAGASSQFRKLPLHPPCTSLVQQTTRPAPYCHHARIGSPRSLQRDTVARGFSILARYPSSCGKPLKSVMVLSVTAGVKLRFCT